MIEDGAEMWETPEGLRVYQSRTVEPGQFCQGKSPLAAQTVISAIWEAEAGVEGLPGLQSQMSVAGVCVLPASK